MRTGKYTVDSIEKGIVKLLYRADEAIEELLPVETFSFDVKEGDLVFVEEKNGQLHIKDLQDEKEDILQQIRTLTRELLDRNN